MTIIAIALLFTACAEKTETVKIGVVIPLSGPFADFGERIQNALELAKFDVNSQDGINRQFVELIYEDTQCKGEKTISSLNKLKNFDNIVAYIGPFCGSPIQVASKFSDENKLVGVSPNVNFGLLSTYFFNMLGLVESEDKLLAEFAIEELNASTAAILYHDNFFGVFHRDAFKKYFEEKGGKLLVSEAFTDSDLDFRSSLLKTKEADVLFIAYSNPGEILNQLAELNINVTVLGQSGAENPEMLRIAKENAEGFLYSFPRVTIADKFKETYVEQYGDLPVNAAAGAYDALNILDYVFEQCKNFSSECASEKIQQLKEYEGASGTMTFNKETWDVGKEYIMKTVRNGKFVELT